jgi:micrococcal nuclease
MNKVWMSVVAILLLSSLAWASNNEEIEAKVVGVIDGNTLEIKSDNSETYTIILAGVDSPELNQEFGDEAKKFLEKMLLKKTVKVTLQGKDRWGNRLAIVTTKANVDIRVELLKAGFAWTAERNPTSALENLRVEAQQKGKGLWKSNEPTPPWVFRREQTLLQEKGS